MAETPARDDGRAAPGAENEASEQIDYRRIESSAEFRELVTRRKRFLTIASVIVFGEFGLYLLLAAFAPGFMGTQIVDGLPVAWLAAMAQVAMTWAVTWAYLRKAETAFEPLERRASALAAPRFTREDPPPGAGGAAAPATSTEGSP
jgi:uncharacterized membrane protein (DUF485 family)